MEDSNEPEHSDITEIKRLVKETTAPMLITKKLVNALGDEVLTIIRERINEHQEQLSEYQKEIAKLKSEHNDEIARIKHRAESEIERVESEYENYRVKLVEKMDNKEKHIKARAKKQRKDSVKRGDRFKSQHDELLKAIDAVLPGAKYLIHHRALSEQEKRQKLKELDAHIEIQTFELNERDGGFDPKKDKPMLGK